MHILPTEIVRIIMKDNFSTRRVCRMLHNLPYNHWVTVKYPATIWPCLTRVKLVTPQYVSPNYVPNLSHLLEIDLVHSSDSLTDRALQSLTNIQYINLSWCNLVTQEGISHLRNVKTIIAQWCRTVSSWNLSHLTKLSCVDFTNSEITDDTLYHLYHVRTVNLSCCPNITDKGLSCLSNVENLTLQACHKVTGTGLCNLYNLKKITIRYCTQIDNNSLTYFSTITTIHIIDCKSVTDEGIAHLISVENLGIVSCPRVKGLTLTSLAHLRTLFVPNNNVILQDIIDKLNNSDIHVIN
jgi:hypothetical protein